MNNEINNLSKLDTNNNIEYSKLIRDACQAFVKNINSDKTKISIPVIKSYKKKPSNAYAHLYHELFLEISGSCVFNFPGYEKILVPGEILLIPRGLPHHEKVLDYGSVKFRNMLLMFMPGNATVHIAETSNMKSNLPKPFFMEKLKTSSAPFYYNAIDAIINLDQNQNNWQETRDQILTSILMKVLNDLGAPTDQNVWANLQDIPCGDPYKIELVKKYITENITQEDLSVTKLAKLAEYSPNYLSSLFRKTTGETIKEFTNRKKMEAARVLLETTPYRIQEIAFSLGYNDPSYFSKIFRRHFGIAPHQYINILQIC